MDFDKVQKLMDNSVADNQVPCSDIIITHKGKIVYRYQNGTKDDKKQVPITGNELYFLYSGTKVITCTALMQLVEKGKLGLEDEVVKYIPEYGDLWVKTPNGAERAKVPLQIKHLFTMTSGLDYNLQRGGIMQQRERKPDSTTLEMVKTFVQEPLGFEPGTRYCYSLSHDVLAAVLELIEDMSFGDYLKKNIFDVCAMENTGFTLNDTIQSKMCSQYELDEKTQAIRLIGKNNEFILSEKYESGGAGLISCVEDYGRFVTELANGNRLLKAETIDLMRQDHLVNPNCKTDFAEVKPGYTYGLGVRTNRYSDFSAKGEFGWDGAAGAYVLVDPDNHIAIFYATHVRNQGVYLYEKLHPAIRDAVYETLLGKK